MFCSNGAEQAASCIHLFASAVFSTLMCEHLCRGPSISTLMYGPGTKDCLLGVIMLKLFWCCPAIQGRHFNYAWGRHQKGLGKVLSFFFIIISFLTGGNMLRHATSEDCLKSYLNICSGISWQSPCSLLLDLMSGMKLGRLGSKVDEKQHSNVRKEIKWWWNNSVNRGFCASVQLWKRRLTWVIALI